MGFSLVVTSGSYSLVAVRGLHIVVASPAVEHRIKPMCPAMAGLILHYGATRALVTQLPIETSEYLYIYMYVYVYIGGRSLSEGVLK